MKTNSQSRNERIAGRERYLRKTSTGVSGWSREYVHELAERFKLEIFKYNEIFEEVVLTTSFGKWRIVHDQKIVYLYHKSNIVRGSSKLRVEFHKQDVFYTLKQAFEYVVEHEDYIRQKK